jgi:hypothetical protein
VPQGGCAKPARSAGHSCADDGTADLLTGGAGRDWFFKGKKCTITDLAADERLG